jgi:hypothetical protein
VTRLFGPRLPSYFVATCDCRTTSTAKLSSKRCAIPAARVWFSANQIETLKRVLHAHRLPTALDGWTALRSKPRMMSARVDYGKAALK